MMDSCHKKHLETAVLSFLHSKSPAKILAVDAAIVSKNALKNYHPHGTLHVWSPQQQQNLLQDGQLCLDCTDYDYIIAGTFLDKLAKPKDAIRQLRMGLKDSGRLISVWHAVNGMDKYIPRLFMSAGFHDLQIQANIPGLWIVSACQFAEDILMLRQQLDEPTRRRLGRLLRRIENDINIQASCSEICRICDRYSIDSDYLFQFIQHTTVCPQQVTFKILENKNDEPA